MNQRLSYILAAVFLIVGVVSAANTFRLNTYIRETLPRDKAQEQCNAETIKVLTTWLELRKQRDGSMDVRDDASVAADEASEKADEAAEEIIDRQLISGQPVSQQELQRWRDAIAARRAAIAARSEATAADRQIRREANEQWVSPPKC